jgi:hypothetical protein
VLLSDGLSVNGMPIRKNKHSEHLSLLIPIIYRCAGDNFCLQILEMNFEMRG